MFALEVAQILPTKFRVNWPFGSGEELNTVAIERKAMIRNRYNNLTPSVQDTKGKEGRI